MGFQTIHMICSLIALLSTSAFHVREAVVIDKPHKEVSKIEIPEEEAPPEESVPSTIQTLPRLHPNDKYHAHLRKIFQDSKKDFVVHKEKLENKVEYLERKIHELKSRNDDMFSGETSSGYNLSPTRIPQQDGDNVGKVVSHMVIGSIVLSAGFFFMTQYSVGTKAVMWQLADLCTAIFLAILWFQAFDDVLEYHQFEEHHEFVAGILHALVLFAIVCGATFYLRKTGNNSMPVIAACGAHYVSFAVIHLASSTQAAFFDSNVMLCFFSVLLILCALLAIASVTQRFRAKVHGDGEWVEVTEELENDLASMALAFAFTMAMRYAICGEYSPMEDGEADNIHHTSHERVWFLVYTVIMSGISAFAIPKLSAEVERSTYRAPQMNEQGESHFKWCQRRLLKLAATTLSMSTAWAVFLWADWQYFETFYRGERIYGRIVFACWATATSLIVFFAMEFLGKKLTGMAQSLFSTVFAIVVAFSWEEVLDQSLETTAEGKRHPVGAKMSVAVAMTIVVLPVYAQYLKPKANEARKAEERLWHQ